MLVEICGLREAESLAVAITGGADAVGFVFAPGSPRTVDAESVRGLLETVPGSVLTGGVFRTQPIDEVVATARAAGVAAVQLHGGEPLSDFDRLRSEGFDAIRALSIDEYRLETSRDPAGLTAHRLLIDAPVPGSGELFDTTVLRDHPPHGDWILAGGLDPRNVAEMIAAAHPAGVDVSSGVESSRGIKDPARIQAFISAARR